MGHTGVAQRAHRGDHGRGARAPHLLQRAGAAGGHHLLMVGPPGAGKSMLATRMASILPPLSSAEALDVAAVHALAASFDPSNWGRRPVRAPHHSASAAALSVSWA